MVYLRTIQEASVARTQQGRGEQHMRGRAVKGMIDWWCEPWQEMILCSSNRKPLKAFDLESGTVSLIF